MLAVYLIPLYILVNLYLARWLLKWLGALSDQLKNPVIRGIVIVFYCFLAGAMGIAFFWPQGRVQRILKLIGNYWLGILLYAILIVALADILRLLLRRVKAIDQTTLHSRRSFALGGGLCAALLAAVTIYGAVNARTVRTTPYEVTVDKKVEGIDSLKIVLAADLHLGYNIGCSQMEKMAAKINAEEPDLVVLAGDIFDNQYDALDAPERLISILRGIKSRYGVYACYGNHDIDENILAGFTFEKKDEPKESDPRMDEFLEKAGIQLLRDETVLIDDKFYLVGRADFARPGRGIENRKTPEELTASLDATRPILVLDHEPREYEELEAAGADLALGGHTHDGQLFPGNIVVDLLWENAYGYKRVGDLQTIVTSGVGLFGPNMRVATRAEVCPITVHFE